MVLKELIDLKDLKLKHVEENSLTFLEFHLEACATQRSQVQRLSPPDQRIEKEQISL